jgi:hypothetical protein
MRMLVCLSVRTVCPSGRNAELDAKCGDALSARKLTCRLKPFSLERETYVQNAGKTRRPALQQHYRYGRCGFS